MIFERPEFLALGPLAAILFAFTVGSHWRRLRRLATSYERTALRRLLPADLGRFPTQRFLCLVGAGTLIGMAVAGPILWDPEPVEPVEPLDLAVAVDLSLSMTAAATTESRIERTRVALARLTEELPSVRFSLLVFAGWPYVLVPPTDDPDIVRYFVDSLQPEVVQDQDRGNSLSNALEMATRTLDSRPSEGGRRAILVLSDGDVFEEEAVVAQAAADAASRGVEVWVGGVGTEEGAPISVGGEPVVDVTGRAVRTSQNVDLLEAVAEAGGGRYADITEAGGLESLVADLRELSGDAQEGPAEPFDTTALFALLAIPLLLWEGMVDARRWKAGVNGGRATAEPTGPVPAGEEARAA